MGLIGLICLGVAGCGVKAPVAEPGFVGSYGRACLPEAIGMAEALRGAGVQAKVLRFRTAKVGHAIAVYLYPPGANKLWGWDSWWASLQLRAFWHNPEMIARDWLRVTRHTEALIEAEFVE
jgi:hypothetical protein